jgi:hypothetical protein
MKTLIERCSSPNPCKRPSFNDIIDYTKSNGFRIIAEANMDLIQMYVAEVRDWEQMRDVKNLPHESQ